MGITIKLEGFAQLDRNLLDLSGPTGERILRKAARAAGEVVQAAITEAAPVRTELRKSYGTNGNAAWNLPPGALKSDITLRVTKKDSGGFTATIGPGKFTAFVAAMLEYGHEAHQGRKYKGGKYLGMVPAHPFIRPAWELSKDAAVAAAEETIADEVIKEIKRLRGV